MTVDPHGLIYVAESDSNTIALGTTGPLLTAIVTGNDLSVDGQPLQGTADPLPAGSLIDFGNVSPGSTEQVTIQVTNSGATTFSNLAVHLNGGSNTGAFHITTPSTSPLFPLETVSFTISFKPAKSVTSTAKVNITSTGGGLNSYSFSIQGE